MNSDMLNKGPDYLLSDRVVYVRNGVYRETKSFELEQQCFSFRVDLLARAQQVDIRANGANEFSAARWRAAVLIPQAFLLVHLKL